MASVLSWTCEACGIEWVADLDADDQRSIYICNCGSRHEVSGTAIGLYCLPPSVASQAIITKEGQAAKPLIQIYAARRRVDRSQDSD